MNPLAAATICLPLILLPAPTNVVFAGTDTPPERLPIAGRLLDSTATPVTAVALDVTFRLYPSAVGGSHVHEETQTLTVVEGLFAAALGDTVALSSVLFSDYSELYLSIQVETDSEMAPRIRLGSAAYSMRAAHADDVSGADINPSSITIAGVPVINSSGVWVGSSDGFSPWDDNGSGLEYAGDVVIGGSNPLTLDDSRLVVAESGDSTASVVSLQEFDGTTFTYGDARLDLTYGNGSLGGGLRYDYADNRVAVEIRGLDGDFEPLRVDGTAGRVGIGQFVTEPEYALDVRGTTEPDDAGAFDQIVARFRPTGLGNGAVFVDTVAPDVDSALLLGGGGEVRWSIRNDASDGDALRFRRRDSSGSAETLLTIDDAGDVVVRNKLQIQGGMDLAEPFETSAVCEPGSVVSIDPDHPGLLEPSTTSYDRCVAGVVSGAGEVQPGLVLSQQGLVDGGTTVAMAGRVLVRCSAENGAIRAGDLLTTASLQGHAMKATDMQRSHGATIGKAMGTLNEGCGLVLVLINLQ